MAVNTFEPNDDRQDNLNDALGKALARTLQDLDGIRKKYRLTESGCHLMFVNSFIFYLVEHENVDERKIIKDIKRYARIRKLIPSLEKMKRRKKFNGSDI